MRSPAAADHQQQAVPESSEAATKEKSSADTAWLETELLAVRDTIELTDGLDGRPLLFDSDTGKYVAVSKAGTVILTLLDGETTARGVVRRVASPSADPVRAETAVIRFLTELRQAGVLTLEPQEEKRRERVLKYSLRQRMPRKPLTRSVHILLEPVAKVLQKLPVPVVVGMWILLTGAGLATAGYALATRSLPDYTVWSGIAALLLILQIAVHELAHALVCQSLRVPVREAGITLMLYVMPVAYVDRTDAYRVRGRAPRALIALAGPMSDAIWAGATALVLLHTSGTVHEVAGALLQLQVLLMIVNLNPLLPSDGYHALESAMGSVNLRGRSFAFLVHLATRAPLPSHLLVSSKLKRVGYCAFGVLCALYGVFMVGVVLTWWWHLIEGLLG
ncbi:PqqD family peptide modification chaperone [Streptomyces erythrochromogenes]|uniref:PqqD family peptide modification chaperone n=1 Tax=Streptomyces erythrochromogenes TaxID=285574 RepID=A0ABZ1QKW6_9ACTN|nr:PqqD family peptide modification chaperone [Streptomyces erythrochromogenes]MCX5588618.1 PqqD family peptide modification chaperone [Streptomyces erythrochromogenes]